MPCVFRKQHSAFMEFFLLNCGVTYDLTKRITRYRETSGGKKFEGPIIHLYRSNFM